MIRFVRGLFLFIFWDHIVETMFIFIFLTVTWMAFMGASYESDKHRRLLSECISDGKKEYECEAILNTGKSDVQLVPVVIPTGR